MHYKTWIQHKQNEEYGNFSLFNFWENWPSWSLSGDSWNQSPHYIQAISTSELDNKQLIGWVNCNFIFISTPVAMLPSDQILQIYYRAVLNPVKPYNLPAHVLNENCRSLVFPTFRCISFFQMTWFLEKLRAE